MSEEKIQNPVAFIIQMYDEFDTVCKTVDTIRNSYENAYIVVTLTKNDFLNRKFINIHKFVDELIILPNLFKTYKLLPNSLFFQNPNGEFGHIICHSGCRNASRAFSALKDKKFDYIVAITGDTHIVHAKGIQKVANIMLENDLIIACSKAYGQNFFSNDSKSAKEVYQNRYQDQYTTDFVNQFYIINGNFFEKTKCLTDIKLTNHFTTEQCYGDNLLQFVSKNELLQRTYLLNIDSPTYCYAFNDGIIYQAGKWSMRI